MSEAEKRLNELELQLEAAVAAGNVSEEELAALEAEMEAQIAILEAEGAMSQPDPSAEEDAPASSAKEDQQSAEAPGDEGIVWLAPGEDLRPSSRGPETSGSGGPSGILGEFEKFTDAATRELTESATQLTESATRLISKEPRAEVQPAQEAPEPEQPKPEPLSAADQETLDQLEEWAENMPESSGAAKQYGAAGVRADYAESYGRLIIAKQRPVSEAGAEALAAIEERFPAPALYIGARLGRDEGEGPVYNEADDILARIESSVISHTTTIVANTGGGAAMPMLTSARMWYQRQPRRTKRAIILVGFVLMVTLYITFYEEEEQLEEEFSETMEDEGIGFGP